MYSAKYPKKAKEQTKKQQQQTKKNKKTDKLKNKIKKRYSNNHNNSNNHKQVNLSSISCTKYFLVITQMTSTRKTYIHSYKFLTSSSMIFQDFSM